MVSPLKMQTYPRKGASEDREEKNNYFYLCKRSTMLLPYDGSLILFMCLFNILCDCSDRSNRIWCTFPLKRNQKRKKKKKNKMCWITLKRSTGITETIHESS